MSKKPPTPTPADIAKAEARAKASAEYSDALNTAVDQLQVVATRFQENDPNMTDFYATGKNALRALTKAYNRLSLFLDLPEDKPAKDPRLSTTVALPVPDALKDHDAP